MHGVGGHLNHLAFLQGNPAQVVGSPGNVAAQPTVQSGNRWVLAQRLLDYRLQVGNLPVHRLVVLVLVLGSLKTGQGGLQLRLEAFLDLGVQRQLVDDVGDCLRKKGKNCLICF